ncbi:hypothetical protein BCR35DRAFT_334692 [Leucosporidium creatinivorum]|uniref:DH domain-containing protein n=1 Tax=Leucosporidium creatinivorum TaxID=106004 RepID=A0A1Y2DZS8_9BASI|nr:hypothetical protein BCR35DRAFT_334692 [Leucosporidium creatinivorum]
MPTILDNSPTISRTLRSLRITDPNEIPVSFRYSDDDRTPGEEPPTAEPAEDSAAEVADDEEAPTSIRQLVQAHRNLSRSGSREFTLQDEKRLSSRVAERHNDGLGLSLEMFDGSMTSYTPVSRPLLTRRTTSLEANPSASTPIVPTLTSTAASYPFPSQPHVVASPTDVSEPTHRSPQLSSAPIPPPARASFGPPSPIERPDPPRRRSSLMRVNTAPSRSRTSSSRSSPAPSPSLQTPPSSTPISREGSPIPSPATSTPSRRNSMDAIGQGLAKPRPRTSGGISSSKSMRRLSSVFTIGRSRSTSGQSLQEMAETEEKRDEKKQDRLQRRPSQQYGTATNRPTAMRGDSDNTSYKTAQESVASPYQSPASSSPFLPTPPRRQSVPPTPSPRLASRASTNSFLSSPVSPTGNPSPSTASHTTSPSLLSPAPLSMRTWRSTISAEEYESLLAKHGAVEMRRQEVIWELCETEKSFVEGLKSVMELFALPLRREQGGWIKGVPVPVSRLLDWATDIVYLHSEISSALQDARRASPAPVVLQVASAFIPYVLRLEIHQPYLVRFEAVAKMIDVMTADPNSDFGEFVRMQSALPECRGMSLGSYLLKPVQRLMKYTLFFKQLADLTPPSHSDHLDTLALLESTDTIIRVMQEVKTREDEYEQIKQIAARLRGLPSDFQLARRDRRLIHQGQLRRVHVGDKDRQTLEAHGRRRSAGGAKVGGGAFGLDSPPVLRFSPNNSRPQSYISDDSGSSSAGAHDAGELGVWPSPLTTPDSANSRHSTFSSTLTTEPSSIGPSLAGFLRPNSMASNTSSASNSDDSNAAASSTATSRPLASTPQVPPSAFSNTMPVRRSSKRIVKTKAKESSVQVFVFSDLVVFASHKSSEAGKWTPKMGSTRRRSSLTGEDGGLRVLDGVGITRVLGVADLSGKTEHDHLIKLDLLPLSSSSERLTPLSLGAFTAATLDLYLTLPPVSTSLNSSPSSTPSIAPRPPALDLSFQSRVQWLQCFERSYLYAYRSLSSTSLLNPYVVPITQTEHLSAEDTQTSFVDSNRRNSLGAPAGMGNLSKSPGDMYLLRFGGPRRDGQGSALALGEVEDAESMEEREAEREERIYWAGRLQKVKREMEAHLKGSVEGKSTTNVAVKRRIRSMGVPSGLGEGETEVLAVEKARE